MFKLNKAQLRWLAMLTMVLDHFAEMFLKPGLEGSSEILTKLHLSEPAAEILCNVFISLGTFTGTVMIYFLIEGYFYTKNLKKYMLRLLLFGMISQVPFYLAFGVPALNILFALAVCLGAIYVHYHVPDSGKKNLMILGLFAINCFTDWTIMAVPITLYLSEAFEPVQEKPCFKVKPDRLRLAFIKSFILMLIIHVISLGSFPKGVSTTCGFVLAAVLISRFYDESKANKTGTEEQGYIAKTFNKYFFYIFYPLHLVILSGVYKLLIPS